MVAPCRFMVTQYGGYLAFRYNLPINNIDLVSQNKKSETLSLPLPVISYVYELMVAPCRFMVTQFGGYLAFRYNLPINNTDLVSQNKKSETLSLPLPVISYCV